MSRPATGGPERGAEAPTRTTRTRDAASAVLVLLALGLAFRLILAYLLPGSGFENDLASFRGWARSLAVDGLAGFYERPFFHDYTPGYLYVLWLVGTAGAALGSIGDLIKLPAILADLALAWLVRSMVLELGGSRRAAFIGAAVVVVNPVTWFDSVVWGQVDSVGVVFLLLAVRELWRDRPERSAILAVVAALIKPQLGILAPIVAAVVIRRALRPAGGHGAEDARKAFGRTTTAWERRARGPIRVLTTGLAGFLAAIALSAPFGLSFVGLIRQIFSTAAGYPYVSVNAYNPWALLELDGRGLALNGTWICDATVAPGADGSGGCSPGFLFGAIPAVVVGTVLLLAVVAAVTLAVARRPDRMTILVGVIVLAVAFFVVPTRVHERYLFPFFALAAILAAVSVRWRVAYVVVSVATFANMYVVLTTIYPGNPSGRDWLGVGPDIRSSWVTAIALVHLAALAWTASELRDGAVDRLRAAFRVDAREPAEDDGAPETVRHTDVDRGSGHALPPSVAPRRPVALAAPASLPVWRERPTLAEAGAVGWFRARLFERPVRPDRTAVLHRERTGRLDRLDLWVVAVLVIAALTLRLWRVAEPVQMHFDEVYHARTATEFLQAWRYGLSHDIYEWTHPHLAKYAMAGGIVALGNDRVTATGDLGVPVRAAAIERRYDPVGNATERAGDRLLVATGTEVRAYDLRTRALVAIAALPGATSLAVDGAAHRLLVGTDDGTIVTLELSVIDALEAKSDDPVALTPAAFASPGDGAVRMLHVTEDGTGIVAILGEDRLVMLDGTSGDVTGEITRPAISQIADAGRGDALAADPAEVPDPAAAAAVVADLLGGEATDHAARLDGGGDTVVLKAITEDDDRAAVDAAIEDGRLEGFDVREVARVVVGDGEGLTFVLPVAGERSTAMALDGGVRGVAAVTGIDDPKVYATKNGTAGPELVEVTVGGSGENADRPRLSRTSKLPAAASWVTYDSATQQVHVLGDRPAGAGTGQTVYAIEPHANAVYADAPLPFAAVAWAIDENERYPASDRQDLLVLSASGGVASIDVGANHVGWRVPGVLAGVAMTALLYLLARILFVRRSVAAIVGLLALTDGMLFVQSRIAMNDAYVGLFIIAAYTIFAGLWTGAWRHRAAFWVGMPAIGLLLGLALASKWVAAYAIGALGILILARSALGRVVLIAGMMVVTTVLGYLAISVPADTKPEAGWQIAIPGLFDFVLQGNLTFALIMIALTLAAVVVVVVHPIAWHDDEVRFAVGAPALGGVAIALVALAVGRLDTAVTLGSLEATPFQLGFALVVASVGVAAAFWVAGRWGFGPLAPPPAADDPAALLEPADPPADGWLRPGWGLGVPVAWMVGSLLLIPLAVYVISYIPWAFVENHRIVAGWPPGHTGQTLLELTDAMYRYHNTLTSPHAASSPWWAWPFNLKPVWFYQESYAGGTGAAVYDAGNLVTWWLGVPAMAFCAWQAFKRRSLGLALIAVGFACQWIPWARIDRAAFQYHYYTSLPFVILGLAYLLAELWHGASRRTWLLARLAAAGAIVAPAAMWLFHRPLCGFVRVEAVNEGSRACPTLIPEFVLTARSAALAIVVGLAVLILVRQLVRLGRPADPGDDPFADVDEVPQRGAVATFAPLAGAAVAAALGLVVATLLFGEVPVVSLANVAVEPVAILVAIPLLLVAAFVATARDARRFVAGTLAAVVAAFAILYPNIAALPLPAAMVSMYQGLLPTYLYPFQFPVSIVDRNVAGPSLLAPGPALLLLALLVAGSVLAYSAWVWRVALAERRLGDRDGDGNASALARTSGDA